ncbi:pilus assembly protein CpaF [Novimethylophilus kurashikiensis]|uniref:Pilus assembly protein CpaF n=1 Tax=Novimethylophilus kurashikiensis TaxID=1825523 RepID=A0A2R5F9Q4_9PROT|nr:hypothetical protein [Novimethylophilus kurashikiensis]GBG14549.1 pilus assembly protein CpaF [Novimethylophilus kurashikiensis]
MDPLLSRKDFEVQVLKLLRGKCCLCSAPATAAHHILDRKLFADGGYRLSNGAPVCDACHWRCETTEVSVEDVRKACGHNALVLPDGFEPALTYDKWGNLIQPDGFRIPGPLAEDTGTIKALTKGGVYWKLLRHQS